MVEEKELKVSNEGWFYEGAGIYRHVWLNQYNNLHIENDGVFVHTNVAEKNTLYILKQRWNV